MKQLAGETNAAHLMAIWNLPESRRFGQQMLEKLSLAPWLLLHRNPDTNAVARLQPLLDDLAENESCLEIRQTSNQPGELVLAIRLDDQRAALWQTNLARVLESLTGIHPVPAPGHNYGWSLKKHHVPNSLELTRVNGWIIVGAAEDHNNLLDELRDRIQHDRPPVAVGAANDWLAADMDLRRVAGALALGWNPPPDLPDISLAVAEEGTNILLHGTADFPRSLALDLKPWNVPTNLVNWNLGSFAMVRGFKPWLESSPAWTNLQIGPLPDQAFFWSLSGSLMKSYFAAPLPDASNEVDRLSDWVLQNQHRWLDTNSLARFEKSSSFDGLDWKGLPYMSPFVRSMMVGNQGFVFGGAFPDSQVYPVSTRWLQNALAQTNLVYFDSEETGARIEQWLFMGQFARFVSHKAQLPFQSPGLLWLKAVASKLGYSGTQVAETGPNQLSFTRQSGLGFTAIELNLLVDWLESPRFPIGLHTFLAPPDELNGSGKLPVDSPMAVR
jgi:hypothetical protein